MTRHITALTLRESLAATAKRKQVLRAYLLGHHRPVTTILIADGGATILSAAESVHVRSWRSGWLERVCADYPGTINALALTPDGQYVIGGGGRDTLSPPERFPLYVWDWRSGERVLELAGHEGIVTAVVVSPDGRTVISGARTMGALSSGRPQPADTIHLWDRDSGSLVSSLRNHPTITALALDPTGERLISGSANGSMVVWDLTQTRPAYVLGVHGGAVNAIVVTPDGRLSISVAADKMVRAWDIAAQRLVGSAILNDQALSCVLTPDGRQVLVGTLDGALHRFALTVD